MAIQRAYKPRKHGHTRVEAGKVVMSPTYRSWAAMKNRVLNERGEDFHHYGGRGIALCERWHTFKSFFADMGERPPGTTLDRIDNDGPYKPGNCRWADQRTQRRNSRYLRYVTVHGERMIRADAAVRLGVSLPTVDAWVRRGTHGLVAVER